MSVDEIQWQEVPSFYGQAASARVFVVTRSPDQTVTTVTFGDGVNGARLTSGTGNVIATYRYGSGAASPPAGRLTTISQPQLNLASIQNPVAVSGGADPQAPEDVQTNAPASVVTFGRAISAADYEAVASQAPGVSRAAAYWTFDEAEQRTLVTVYVGDDQAAVAAAAAALAGAEDPNRPVSVTGANPIDLSLSCTLVVAAGQQVRRGGHRGDGGGLRLGGRPVQPRQHGHRATALPQRHRRRAHGARRRRRPRPHGHLGRAGPRRGLRPGRGLVLRPSAGQRHDLGVNAGG